MKVYITKYALTIGIIEEEATTFKDTAMIEVRGSVGRADYYHGKDWHLTKEDAIVRAEEMRKAKIISLSRAIGKLDRMIFE